MAAILDIPERDDTRIFTGDSVEYFDYAADCHRWGVMVSPHRSHCVVRDILGHEHFVPTGKIRLWKLTGKPHPTDEALVIARAEARPAQAIEGD